MSSKRSLPLLGDAPPARQLHDEVRACDRQAKPSYCVWEITLQCDLACRHCGSRAGHARDGELNTAECLDLVAQLAEMGCEEISLIGGEVYLRDDWAEIARAVVDHGMACGIVSGGRGMTRERIDQAQAAGVNGMSISIDGLEESHDDLRALKGSWQAARQALRHLEAADMPRAINTQINRRNLHEIPDMLPLLKSHGVYAWQVQFTVAMGRAADHHELLLQPYEMIDLLPMLASLKPALDEANITLWPGNNIGYFGPFESLLRGDMACGHHEPCAAGRSAMGIEANGDIKGCPSLPTSDYVGGNIREHSLREIWQRAEELRFTRERKKDELWGHCADCYYAEDCLAGCTWTSHVLFGRRGNNPYCHHRALELHKQNIREVLVPEQPAAGLPFDFGRFGLREEPWPQDEHQQAQAIIDGNGGLKH